MADLALVTAGKINVIESIEQATLPAAEDISAGQAVRIDTANGKFTKSNATVAAEARVYGVAVRTVKSGEPVTAVKRGLLDGFDLSALSWDAPIYLSDTDGSFGSTAGTVSTVVGAVFPAPGQTIGTALDKVLRIAL